MSIIRVCATLVSGGLLLGACQLRPVPVVVSDAAPPPVTLDEALVEIAEILPGFGGVYVAEDGTLTVQMVGAGAADAARDERIRGVVAGVLGAEMEQGASGFRVVAADYDVLQLSSWRGGADAALALPGVLETDLDERRNRVVIGVAGPEARPGVERLLASRGVPLEAVIVEEVEPAYAMDDLEDKFRPVHGGVQVESDTGVFYASFCTMGFNAILEDGRRGFLTNSHCTESRGGVDGTEFHQPTDPLTINPWADQQYVGAEVYDRDFFRGGICPEGRVCRRSDAAFIAYSSSSDYGSVIVRPELYGSTELASERPFYRIVGEVFFPLAGAQLHKVGRTTGLTPGAVSKTCVNANDGDTPDVTFLCQYRADRSQGVAGRIVDEGDSGSPVFRLVDERNVDLYGLLWGGASDGSYFIFSSMMFLHLDTPFDVEFSERPPPPPLGCEIEQMCRTRAETGVCMECMLREQAVVQ